MTEKTPLEQLAQNDNELAFACKYPIVKFDVDTQRFTLAQLIRIVPPGLTRWTFRESLVIRSYICFYTGIVMPQTVRDMQVASPAELYNNPQQTRLPDLEPDGSAWYQKHRRRTWHDSWEEAVIGAADKRFLYDPAENEFNVLLSSDNGKTWKMFAKYESWHHLDWKLREKKYVELDDSMRMPDLSLYQNSEQAAMAEVYRPRLDELLAVRDTLIRARKQHKTFQNTVTRALTPLQDKLKLEWRIKDDLECVPECGFEGDQYDSSPTYSDDQRVDNAIRELDDLLVRKTGLMREEDLK